jgi:hypothetical protein
MNESDLARIEAALGIPVPVDYRELMLARREELQEAGQAFPSLAETLFLEADQVIRTNLVEREADMGTASAFPRWWTKFFLVGTNGGGDYFCLRLAGDRHVWMIGSDCGSKPAKQFESFADYIEDRIQSYDNPEPLPSSFDDSCPLLNRFQIVLWEDRCKIRPQEGDRPLTSEKLRTHGIAASDVESCVKSMVAALSSSPPEAVRISDQAPPPDSGEFMIGFQPPAMADSRLARAQADIYSGYIQVTFRLATERSEKAPAPAKVKVAWTEFQAGVVRLLETLHPPGTKVTITQPKAEPGGLGPQYEWTYVLNYSLKSR